MSANVVRSRNDGDAKAVAFDPDSVEDPLFRYFLTRTFDSTPRRGEKLFAMAISREALPKIITVDWTFNGTWGLASIIKNNNPELANEVVFCEVVRRRGSVAVYEGIPAELLRVWTKGQPFEDPARPAVGRAVGCEAP
jgi:hypothetical protein